MLVRFKFNRANRWIGFVCRPGLKKIDEETRHPRALLPWVIRWGQIEIGLGWGLSLYLRGHFDGVCEVCRCGKPGYFRLPMLQIRCNRHRETGLTASRR